MSALRGMVCYPENGNERVLFVYEVCEFLNFSATSIAAIRNRTPQMKLANMSTMKTPIPLPVRNPIPTAPFAMNSHFM